MPLSLEDMRAAIVETVARRALPNQYVRVVVSRGAGDLGLDPRLCRRPSVVIIADTITLYPAHFYTNGLELVTVATRRTPTWALDPRIKSLNYLNNILAKLEAQQAGVLEAVMLNGEGYVAECTADNIFFVRQGQLCTPSTAAGALQGVTRDSILEVAQELGQPTTEGLFTRYDLYTADECFITGTGAEIIPCGTHRRTHYRSWTAGSADCTVASGLRNPVPPGWGTRLSAPHLRSAGLKGTPAVGSQPGGGVRRLSSLTAPSPRSALYSPGF